ncbi:septal ring lytic transglycosylase RlpA family protein [Aquibaculum arenosum]|uniref:Endolytic peptidoglycan transglycosylase RlpA n=1 Tax=Aquibaculum arenosum TaxID=3032591 RepID=A0ABT5YQ46_9PROT|nr:septal ring lytic transglycosylase RlpA family protein [Fodinicurvata sp. CAU 1616]MDF2096309.1 septal ring lytic transglycosylase RlpA family protein [Fodinicurvata sp. CAU 1616]
MAALATMALALAGCGSTQTASTPGASKGGSPAQVGSYKVGRPYRINGVWYHPAEDPAYDQTGVASWYGPGFHGRRTANGERYNQNDLTAAHPTLPMPSMVQVTNLDNGRSIKLRINDRGPFSNSRIIDVSHRAAQLLGFERQGTAKVRVRVVPEESQQLAALARGEAVPPLQESKPPPAAPAEPQPVQVAEQSQPDPAPAQTVEMPDGLIHFEETEPSNLFIQAGAFTDYSNATQLAARLEPLGYVQIEPAAVSGQSFYRVRIGPVESVDEADGLLARLISDGYTESRVIVQ